MSTRPKRLPEYPYQTPDNSGGATNKSLTSDQKGFAPATDPDTRQPEMVSKEVVIHLLCEAQDDLPQIHDILESVKTEVRKL